MKKQNGETKHARMTSRNDVRRARSEARNPIIEGLRDKSRCRVFHGGVQCESKCADGDELFCAEHQAWWREGRLSPELCPVFDGTNTQCDRPARGESGAGGGVCSAHYQSARRGTPPGTEKQQSPHGEGKDGNASFRWLKEPKSLFDKTAREDGLTPTDVHKQRGYLYLMDKGRLPQLLNMPGCLEDMLQCGLREKLVAMGVELEAA